MSRRNGLLSSEDSDRDRNSISHFHARQQQLLGSHADHCLHPVIH